jgi:hypothetical protein
MKKIFIFFILAVMPFFMNGQDFTLPDEKPEFSSVTNYPFYMSKLDETDISKFSLSINPLGFIQFGPVINAEFGIKENMVINTHVRFPSVGVLSYVVKYHSDGLDELSGIAFGGGLVYFFGENMSKPYIGGMVEYHRTECLYAKDESWEWSQIDRDGVFIFNAGFRWRFEGGFFVNTGAFLGAAIGNYEWEYADLSYGLSDNTSRDGKDITPFGMFEVTLGIEF